jgi:succinyl-CoA synthetase beta subunit
MNLHEYQAKELLSHYGISSPKGKLAETLNEIKDLAKDLNHDIVLKAQIHAGGRGKAGGVKLVNNKKDAVDFATELLGKNLITYQNKPYGQPVHKILFEETVKIKKELYFSMLIDREKEKICVVVSSAGGMEIEEISKTKPELILKEFCNPITGLMDFQSRQIAYLLNMDNELTNKFIQFNKSAYKVFTENNLSLLEINPLVIDDKDDLL